MPDVFISYQHNSVDLVKRIVSTLEKNDIKCWYAPRDVTGDYATSICNAILAAPIFVVIMTEEAGQSDQVLNEVEMAYERLQKKEISILPFKANSDELSLALKYYLKRLQWVTVDNGDTNTAIIELRDRILRLLGREVYVEKNDTLNNTDNKSFDYEDDQESKRLETQARIVQQFDQDIYERVLAGRKNLVCVDFGCNDGSAIARRFLKREEVDKIIGLEYNQALVEKCNKKYQGTKIKSFVADFEDENIDSVIKEVLSQNNCEKIDIAVFSFVLMHIKNQERLLKAVYHHLSDEGIVIIADADDGIYLAYPDRKGHFERAIRLIRSNIFGGNRFNGRGLYNTLLRSGFTDIRLERCGLNTTGMDEDAKMATFDMNFSYLDFVLKLMLEKQPENAQLMDDAKWWEENRETIQKEFMEDGFFFLDSTMIFTAKK